MDRQTSLDRVRERSGPWDVIVIGGGATGCGCALDAASRGLDVLLLERDDLGKGTSSRSTKLIHGGVRYLEQGNVRLVREALRERSLLESLAPDFISRTRFVIPCYRRREIPYYWLGLKAYGILSGSRSFGSSGVMTAAGSVESLPGLKRQGLRGAVTYFDGQFDDASFLIAIASESYRRGAAILNYAEVVSLLKSASGKIGGVVFRDAETGEEFEARAKSVVNAAGVFCDEIRKMGGAPDTEPLTKSSRGIHLVFERGIFPGEDAMLIPRTSDGRVLFAIPWKGVLIVGTTDTEVEEASREPSASKEEIGFILDTCSEYFETPPAVSEVKSVFAGLRPLVAGGRDAETSRISRGHTIEVSDGGLVTITGGKWTTYRSMARDTIDAAAGAAGLSAGPSVTAEIGFSVEEKLAGIRRIADEREEYDSRISEKFPYTFAEADYSVRHEMARSVEDVLARRTRLLFQDAEEAMKAAAKVADVLGSELGWDQSRKAEQVRLFGKLAQNYLPSSVCPGSAKARR